MGDSPQWEKVQVKTFTNWTNGQLRKAGTTGFEDLIEEIGGAVKLMQLIRHLYGIPIPTHNKNPKSRIHVLNNLEVALNMVMEAGIVIKGTSTFNLIDKDKKMILGLIWSIILHYQIAGISVEEKSAKEGLLLWCQKKTEGYKDVKVTDFTTSWQNGLALCALIHRHRPDLLKFDSLDKANKVDNLNLAFDVAFKDLGVDKLLDAEDIVSVPKPDERSIVTYVSEIFHVFSGQAKQETAARRVGKLYNFNSQTDSLRHSYEEKASGLLQWIEERMVEHSSRDFDGTYANAKQLLKDFHNYKKTDKQKKTEELNELEVLFDQIQNHLKSKRRAPYVPPETLSLQAIDDKWNALTAAEKERQKAIGDNLSAVKDKLRKEFAEEANAFAAEVHKIGHGVVTMEGDLEAQLVSAKQFEEQLNGLTLDECEARESRVNEAGIEENEYTEYTVADLVFMKAQGLRKITKKIATLEQTIAASKMTNLTPEQVDEFKATFKHFDTDQSGTLNTHEFKAGLAGLGKAVTDEEFSAIWKKVSGNGEIVTFDEFVDFMITQTLDTDTEEQLVEAFAVLAQGKEFVVESDLTPYMPSEQIDYFKKVMPAHPAQEGALDFKSYMKSTFV